MKIKKEDLSFLSIYVALAGKQSLLANKLQIKVKNNKAIFCQFSFSATLVKEIDLEEASEDIEFIYPVESFHQWVSKVPEDSIIEITSKGLSFEVAGNKSALYKFAPIDIQFPEYDDLLSSAESKKQKSKKITFADIPALKKALPFVGAEGTMNFVSLMEDHIVSLDQIVLAIQKCENQYNLEKQFIVQSDIADLWVKFIKDTQSIDIYIYDSDDEQTGWIFELEGITIVLVDQSVALPEVFTDGFRKVYDHEEFVSVESKKLKEVLDRMSIVAKDSPNNRIFIKIDNDKLLIENRDYNLSVESLSLKEANPKLNGLECAVGCGNLSSIIDLMQSNLFYIHFATGNNSDGNRSVKFTDGTEDVKYAHVYYNVE